MLYVKPICASIAHFEDAAIKHLSTYDELVVNVLSVLSYLMPYWFESNAQRCYICNWKNIQLHFVVQILNLLH